MTRAQVGWSAFVAFMIGLVVVLGLRSEDTRERVTRVEVAQAACEKPRSKECRRQIRLVLRAMRALGALPPNESDSKNRKPGSKEGSVRTPRSDVDEPHAPEGGDRDNPPPGGGQPPPAPDDSGGGGGSTAPEPNVQVGPVEVDLSDLQSLTPPVLPDVDIELPGVEVRLP